MITTLRDGENLLTDPTGLVAQTFNYFTNIFGFAGEVEDSYLIDIIPPLVYDSMNAPEKRPLL